LHARGIRKVDVVAGGPPCQPCPRRSFEDRSLIANGKREATDHRAELWKSLIEIASTLRPNGEMNVPRRVVARMNPLAES
jgi:site-specific DNA-cytosine methylase